MNKLITTLLLFTCLSLQAQQNEIKIDAFGFLYHQVNISYEKMIKNRLGIELGIGYIFDPERLDTVDFFSAPLQPGIYGTLPFKKSSFSFLAAAKYYKILKPRGNRVFLGTYLEYRTKPKIEAAYFETYEFYFNEPDKFTPDASFILGGLVGFKIFLIKKKFLIEPLFGLGLDLIDSEFGTDGNGITTDGIIRLNLGYRF